MPEVVFSIDGRYIKYFTAARLGKIDGIVTTDIEQLFGIERMNDVEFKVPEPPRYARGVKVVGIDINYTEDGIGEDQYYQGKPFQPTIEVQKALVKKIKKDITVFCKEHGFSAFCKKHKLPSLSIGVWSKPHIGTCYE